jgi:hypothetical protein
MPKREIKIVVRARDELSRIMGKMGLSLNSLRTGFRAVTKAAKILAATVIAVGGALTAIAVTTARAGDEFQKMSLRTGVSAEALSELKHAAEISGASIEDLEKGFKTFAKRMSDARFGLETYQRIFRLLNLEYQNADGSLRNVDDAFMDAVQAINRLSSDTEKAALAQELFGRAGTKLLPLIKAGKDGIADLRKEAQSLGITYTDLEAEQSAEFIDALTRTKAALKGVTHTIGVQLIPAFTRILDQITDFVTKNPDFITAIDKVTFAFKSLADTLGFDALSPLEKVNKEIAAMQQEASALGPRLFGTSIEFNKRLNFLLGERVRLLALEASAKRRFALEQKLADEKARIKREEEDKARLLKGVDTGTQFDAQITAFKKFLAEKNALLKAQEELEAQKSAAQEGLDALGRSPAAGPINDHQAQLDELNQFNTQKLLLMQQAGFSEAELAAENARMVIEQEKKKRQFQMNAASKTFGGITDFANNMYTILGQKGKAFAKVAKASAIVQAVIEGKKAAVSAWAAGMAVQPQGPWNPIIAAAFTAASLAKTGALIASIGGSQGGGGGGIGGGGTIRTAPTGGFNTEFPAPTVPVKPTQTVNITIHTLTGAIDDKAQEAIIDAINDGGDRNLKINANVIAAGA